jgi:hypothetical protein
MPILQDQTFMDWISKRYTISNVEGIMQDEVSEKDIEQVYQDLEKA